MRAVQFEQFGEPAEVLKLADVPVPALRTGEVRVRMLASPVNPSDLMTIRGVYGKLPNLPATPGFEGVGIVEQAGGGRFGKYLLGKRVVVLNRSSGNWCEQTIIPARQAIPIPDVIPVDQAAMFFVNPAAAYVMTRTLLRVPPGIWLLQTAAGSALGRMVIRLGKRFGFKTFNVVRRADQVDELRALGGDAVFAFDPLNDDTSRLRDEVHRVTAKDGLRYAIDPVGGETASAVVSCLTDGGRMLVYGTLCDEPLSFSPRTLMTHMSRVEGFWLSRWILNQSIFRRLLLVRNISKLMREGVLISEVGQSFPLDRISEAVRAAEQPRRHGKVLLQIAKS